MRSAGAAYRSSISHQVLRALSLDKNDTLHIRGGAKIDGLLESEAQSEPAIGFIDDASLP
jgi:hypothetical protein